LLWQPAGATCRAKGDGCAVLEITKSALVMLHHYTPTTTRAMMKMLGWKLMMKI